MAKISEMVEIHEKVNANDEVINKTINRTTRKVEALGEPDYIKLYTKMWCEFNGIPVVYRELFLQLAIRMSYANASDVLDSQVVHTGKPTSDSICKALGWTTERMYQKGLKALCDCGAIRRVNKGAYQINPSYAGRGTWRYNARLKQGGIEDLVATFDFVKGTVATSFTWGDEDGNEQVIQASEKA